MNHYAQVFFTTPTYRAVLLACLLSGWATKPGSLLVHKAENGIKCLLQGHKYPVSMSFFCLSQSLYFCPNWDRS